MAGRIVRITLTLLAVFAPIIAAKIMFADKISMWFEKKENSFIGFPVTKEGYILSAALAILIIILLLIINNYT